jgi:hypothetical protein
MWFKSLLVVLCLALVVGVSAGCTKTEEGYAEKAGKALDKAVDDTKDAVAEAGEEVADGAAEMMDEVGEAVEESDDDIKK